MALFGAAGPALAQDVCPGLSDQAESVELAGLDSHGDLALSDGRKVRLYGIAPRQNAEDAARFAQALQRWHGSVFRLVVLGKPDRWARLAVRLLYEPPDPEAATVDLAASLLRAKAAWRLPEAGYPACEAVLRIAEGRTSSVAGHPRPLEPGTIDGLDLAGLKARIGEIAVLEGRVVSVGERPQRTYLNFSRRRGEGASIGIARKLWREMQAAGWTAAALKDKRIRVRGVLGGQDGLAMDLSAQNALELID